MKMPFILCLSASALLFSALLLTGCGKSNGGGAGLSVRIDGTNYSFDSVAAWVDTTGGVYIISIDAANTKSHSHMTVEAQSNNKTLKGLYSRLNPPPTDHILPDFIVIILSGQSLIDYALEGESFSFSIDNADNQTLHGSFTGSVGNLVSGKSVPAAGQFQIPYKYR